MPNVDVSVDANKAVEQMSKILDNWGNRHSYFKGGYEACTKDTVDCWYRSGYNVCVIWDGCCSINKNSDYVYEYSIKCARPGDPSCVFGYTTFRVIVMPKNLDKSVAGTVVIKTSSRGYQNWCWDGDNITSFDGGNGIQMYS
tara:strand:+ start:54 stop:479 length:426 start_codon:yes stop_codon:yes gene_type:complete